MIPPQYFLKFKPYAVYHKNMKESHQKYYKFTTIKMEKIVKKKTIKSTMERSYCNRKNILENPLYIFGYFYDKFLDKPKERLYNEEN